MSSVPTTLRKLHSNRSQEAYALCVLMERKVPCLRSQGCIVATGLCQRCVVWRPINSKGSTCSTLLVNLSALVEGRYSIHGVRRNFDLNCLLQRRMTSGQTLNC